MNWVLTIFDWMPLIGGWAFIPQLLVIWIALLVAPYVAFWIAAVAEGRNKAVEKTAATVATTVGIGSVVVGICSLLLLLLAGIAVGNTPEQPVPAQSTPIPGAANMDRKVFHVRGDQDRRATVVVYGHREGDAFEVRGYRVKITGGDVTDQAGWAITASRGYRSANYGVYSTDSIRADGQWQWGTVSQRGTFSSGQTFGLNFWFDDARDADEILMPVTF